MQAKIAAHYLGKMAYARAQRLMNDLKKRRLADEIEDTILFLEHPPVITAGRRPVRNDLLVSEAELKRQGIALIDTDRGGRLTYHGPGQLVGYFIFNIRKMEVGIEKFVWMIEEGLRLFLSSQGIEALRDEKNPGLWLGPDKIAQLGLHVERGVTTHGFSLNVSMDKKPFSLMIPCGIRGAGVITIKDLLGKKLQIKKISQDLATYYGYLFKKKINLLTGI